MKGNPASESLWVATSGKQFAKAKAEFLNSEKQVVIRLITPLRMSYEESYPKAFPFEKMVSGMLDSEMVEDTVRFVNEARSFSLSENDNSIPPIILQAGPAWS